MARTQRPTRTSAVAGNGTAAPAAANDVATNFDVELVRSVVHSSLGASQGLLGFLEQMQQLNARTLKEMSARLNEAVAEAGRAHDLQQLLAVQVALANGQMASAAQAFGTCVARCMDAEVQFIEQAQQGAARLSRQMLGDDAGAGPLLPAQPTADMAALDWLGTTQNALTEMTGRWVEMAKMTAAGKSLPQF